MPSTLLVEGNGPLVGSVKVSGSKLSLQNILAASLFSNEDVIIENVPEFPSLQNDIDLLRLIGVKVEWAGQNRLIVNAATLSNSDIPPAAKRSRITLYLVGPLLFRFGKLSIPLPDYLSAGWKSINRWITAWQNLGIEVIEDGKSLNLRMERLEGATINFRTSTYRGTCNAIISSLFVPGETLITNAAEEPEVDDLINFCNDIGGQVERLEPRKIKVTGKHVFRGGYFELQPDRNDAVMFAIGGLITNGNITVQNVNKNHLVSLANLLTKVGARYEFFGNELRVWRAGEVLKATQITTAPAPGFMSDWQPYTTLLLTRAEGESLVHDTVNTNRFAFVQDLNRMGAKIYVLRPSELGIQAIISDDAYDYDTLGEPLTVAKITGPTKLKATKLNISSPYSDATLLFAALCAEGRSDISDFENITNNYDQLLDKLAKLGAKFSFS